MVFEICAWVPPKSSTMAPDKDKQQQWFSRQEAADYLRISYNTLKAWKIPFSRVKGRVRYSKEDLDNCLASYRYDADRQLGTM